MTIKKELNGSVLTMCIEGRLDTMSAPDLEKEFNDSLKGITEVILDFTKLEYISSAGLRALIAGLKILQGKGTMRVVNADEIIREVFEVTGFDQILPLN